MSYTFTLRRGHRNSHQRMFFASRKKMRGWWEHVLAALSVSSSDVHICLYQACVKLILVQPATRFETAHMHCKDVEHVPLPFACPIYIFQQNIPSSEVCCMSLNFLQLCNPLMYLHETCLNIITIHILCISNPDLAPKVKVKWQTFAFL